MSAASNYSLSRRSFVAGAAALAAVAGSGSLKLAPLALAEEEGYELDHEELESIAGGDWSPAKALPQCPACGSYAIYTNPLPGTGCASCACHDCGYQ